MNTLGWCLLGAGIYVFVALAIPMVTALVFERPPTKDDAHLLVGLSWLWPVLGPLLLAGMCIALPIIGLISYSEWLVGKPKQEEEKPIQGKVVE